jgi:hypothetical protein
LIVRLTKTNRIWGSLRSSNHIKTAQGRRLAKVACAFTVLVGGQRPRRC